MLQLFYMIDKGVKLYVRKSAPIKMPDFNSSIEAKHMVELSPASSPQFNLA